MKTREEIEQKIIELEKKQKYMMNQASLCLTRTEYDEFEVIVKSITSPINILKWVLNND